MNSKIALSGLSILAALAIVGGATYAAFSSAASNTGNTFGAGSLTLKINGFGGSTSTPIFSVSNAAPGSSSGPLLLNLSNTGTVNGSTTKLTGIDVTPSGDPPNLGGKLTLTLYNDVDDNGTLTGPDTVIGSAHLTDPAWTNLSLGFGLAAGTDHGVLALLSFDSDADDSYQGTGVNFNLNFKLDQ